MVRTYRNPQAGSLGGVFEHQGGSQKPPARVRITILFALVAKKKIMQIFVTQMQWIGVFFCWCPRIDIMAAMMVIQNFTFLFSLFLSFLLLLLCFVLCSVSCQSILWRSKTIFWYGILIILWRVLVSSSKCQTNESKSPIFTYTWHPTFESKTGFCS